MQRDKLNQYGFCLRAGLHCSPLAHYSLGTPDGTVRFAPSVFNNEQQVESLVKTIKKNTENIIKTIEIICIYGKIILG